MDCTLRPTGASRGDEREYTCPHCGVPWWHRLPATHLHRMCGSLLRTPAEANRGPCVHRGDETRREECQTCQGKTRIKVFGCALHGECTVEKPIEGAAVCAGCGDWTAAIGRDSTILLRFKHGLGDHVQFTVVLRHLQELRPDLTVDVECEATKAGLFAGLCRRVYSRGRVPPAAQYDLVHWVPWEEPREVFADSPSGKADRHLREVHGIEPRPELSRYAVAIPAAARARAADWYAAQGLVAGDGRFPAALIHNDGITAARKKNLPEAPLRALVDRLLAHGLTPVVLDWHDRSPLGGVHGVVWPRRGDPLWGGHAHADPCLLAALAEAATICFGVDSGPGHIFGATETPTVITWLRHHPLHYYGLSPNVLHLVRAGHAADTRADRPPGSGFAPARDFFPAHYRHQVYTDLAEALPAAADALLGPRRFLDNPAADAQFAHWIGDRCRGRAILRHGAAHDRQASLAVLFAEMRRRFTAPRIVETGCIRSWDDWSGAGYFTYLAGFYCAQAGGTLDSVDLDPAHCAFARDRCRWFEGAARVHQADSVAWLRQRSEAATTGRPCQQIDVLYLDSLDTYEPGHAEHCLAEVQAALPTLHDRSIVVVDDCPRVGGRLTGKGMLAVPWLVERGWRLLFDGYQQVLVSVTGG